MNAMEQVLDNTAVFADFKPLGGAELAVIRAVAKIIEANTAAPCTGCAYCTRGCPKSIAIPQYFALYNNITRTTGSWRCTTTTPP